MLFNKIHSNIIWLPSYISDRIKYRMTGGKAKTPIHIIFCMCDHFEPYWGEGYEKQAIAKIESWKKCYSKIAEGHRDADGHMPKHTFFYPIEQYRQEFLNVLAEFCHQGYGEVEVHLHHDNDTAENLRKTLMEFKQTLANKHGLLSVDKETGEICYGFIHGNWALDNSRRDGRWCGVNNEISILKETGCYADFTLPSAPSETQTRKINSIYYVLDDPAKPKSHDTGIDAEVGKNQDDRFLIIQGPLTLNFKKRKWGLFPGVENGEISAHNPPSKERINLWIEQNIHIKGKPDWIFVKVHCHGAKEENMNSLLGGMLDSSFSCLERYYNDNNKFILHYVTAREMFNIFEAARCEYEGHPHEFRDFRLKKIQ